jgi:hypothetical protein
VPCRPGYTCHVPDWLLIFCFRLSTERQLRYIRTLWMKRWYRSLVSGSRLSTAFRYLDRQNIYYAQGTSAGCSKACFQSNTNWGGGRASPESQPLNPWFHNTQSLNLTRDYACHYAIITNFCKRLSADDICTRIIIPRNARRSSHRTSPIFVS